MEEITRIPKSHELEEMGHRKGIFIAERALLEGMGIEKQNPLRLTEQELFFEYCHADLKKSGDLSELLDSLEHLKTNGNESFLWIEECYKNGFSSSVNYVWKFNKSDKGFLKTPDEWTGGLKS